MRYVLSLVIALVALGFWTTVARAPNRQTVVHAAAIPLDRDAPDHRAFGALEFTGAWKLTSNNSLFGGISSMFVRDGRIVALSDSAQILRFPIPIASGDYPLRQRPLPGIFGYKGQDPDKDSESMTLDPASGRIWVGFEKSNAIRIFSRNFGRKQNWVAPQAMAGWPENAGPEAMVRLRDGRFIVFSEEADGPAMTHAALLFPGDPVKFSTKPLCFYYRPPAGFDATDAAQLPDGRLIVLNRHFSVIDGVAAAITLVDPREIRNEAIVSGRLIATLAPPLTIDNMEALALETGEGAEAGKIIVWIASDDNHNPLQQTLLMRFRFDPARIN